MVSLVLTACKDNQYTCDDGTCIEMNSRCDRKEDCSVSSSIISCYLHFTKSWKCFKRAIVAFGRCGKINSYVWVNEEERFYFVTAFKLSFNTL